MTIKLPSVRWINIVAIWSYGAYVAGLFPPEAVYEAQELTEGPPYSARGSIKVTPQEQTEAEGAETIPADAKEMINAAALPEYQALVERYSDETAKNNYVLMNEDFIQFAPRSKIVTEMIQPKHPPMRSYFLLSKVGSRCWLIRRRVLTMPP